MSEPELHGPYRFYLERIEDETGISGTGRIADGVRFADDTAVLRWRTEHRSTAVYDSMAEVEAIHGHNGKTQVVWIDPYPSGFFWRGARDAYQDRCEGCMFSSIGGSGSQRPDTPVPPKYIRQEEAYDYLRGYNAQAKEMGW